MKPLKYSFLALALLSQAAGAQTKLQFDVDGSKPAFVLAAKDTVHVGYAAGINTVAVMSNTTDYTVEKKTTDADWVSFRKEKNGNLTFFSLYNYDNQEGRTAAFALSTPDGKVTRTLVVAQPANTSASEMGDKLLEIKSATASSSEGGEGIERSYDGNVNTLWHSSYSGCAMPVTLTYTFAKAGRIDYMRYTPRTNGSNGNFGRITVYYATAAATGTWVKVADADCAMSNAPTVVDFGEGIDNVAKVKIEVNTAQPQGTTTMASCAEMEFFTKDHSLDADMAKYFASSLCDALKPGLDEATVMKIPNPYLRQLAMTLLKGDYSTEFRVGSFDCYLNRGTLQRQLRTNMAYDVYENPTGIYFEEGEKIVVFAEGIDKNYPVQLIIKSFSNANDIETEGQPESYYSLSNGANVITAANRGNGYVSYFSNTPDEAPQVKLHFAMSTENGYFDASRHTNADYQQMLANAKSDILDILTQRIHMPAPVAGLKQNCPKDAETLAKIVDNVIYREREIMGLPQLGKEPKNHQFARPVAGGMFADGYGAAASFGGFNGWIRPSSFDFWGFGHELGHVNQITPGFKWPGCGETTNNIYSAWVQHKVGAADAYGTGEHRLEDEASGVNDYSGTRGGRFQTYLEEGVRKGVSWQLQDGPDYHGTTPNTIEVNGYDADGNFTGKVTTTSRNYDHFVKVVPFWQLTLWTEECAKAPTTFGRMIDSYRTEFDASVFNTSGKQQIEMMKRFCDAGKINFLSFFEKAGMLKPVNAYIEDYSPGWLIINEAMITELKEYVASKGYPEAPAALNYINALNWERFRDEVKLTDAGLGTGTATSGSNRIRVDNDVWTGAVGYETYNSNGELIRITMFGLGDSQRATRYTYVLFPAAEDANYIMAVGYDGTKVKCYQK